MSSCDPLQNKAYKVLMSLMNSVRLHYGVSIQRLLETVKRSKEDIFEGMQVVIRETPYQSCWDIGLLKLRKCWVGLADMRNLMGCFSMLVSQGAYVHLFCSVMWFKKWYEILVGESSDDVLAEDMMQEEEVQNEKTAGFKVIAYSLHYVRAISSYHGDWQFRHLWHSSVHKWRVHFLRKDLWAVDMLGCIS